MLKSNVVNEIRRQQSCTHTIGGECFKVMRLEKQWRLYWCVYTCWMWRWLFMKLANKRARTRASVCMCARARVVFFAGRGLIFCLFRWGAAWLEGFLYQIESYSFSRLVLCNCNVVHQTRVPNVRRIAIPLLAHQPLKLACVRMPSPNVFRLQMLQLCVDIVPRITHPASTVSLHWLLIQHRGQFKRL